MTLKEISVQDLEALGAEARIVDVREPAEYDAGHIADATLVPLASVPEHVGVFDGEPTYVVCRSGGRSANACAYLADRGVDVVNVSGGMIAWAAAGFEVATGSAGTARG